MSVEHIDTASLFRVGATSRRILNKERGVREATKDVVTLGLSHVGLFQKQQQQHVPDLRHQRP